MTDNRYQLALDYMTELHGEEMASKMEASLRKMSGSFTDYALSSTYGQLPQRTNLDRKSRQLVTIAVIATLGGCEPQLRLHIRMGLKMGLTGDEIVEAIVQVFAYAGAPRGSGALRVAAEVFEKLGVTVD
jgi:4-carboxymuconolactone decarboxylase